MIDNPASGTIWQKSADERSERRSSRYRRLRPYIFRQWRWLAAISAFTLATSAVAALQPWPIKLLVDYALQDTPTPAILTAALQHVGVAPTPAGLVVLAAVASVVLFVLESLLVVGLSLSWSIAGQRMVYDLAGELFARLQRLSLLFHSRRSVGDSLSRLTEDTWCIYTLTDGLISPIQQLITLVALSCIGFLLDPPLTVICLAVAPLLAWASRFFGHRLKRRSKLGREAKSRLMSFVHQSLGAVPIVQAFGTERRNTGYFQDLSGDAVVLSQRGNLLSGSYGLATGLITTTGMAIVLYVGGMRVLSGAIPIGTLLVFTAYVRQMQSASSGLFKTFAALKAAEASVDRIFEVLESEDHLHDAPDARPLPEPCAGRGGDVRLESISFGYEPERLVLRDVSLEARPGETIALVGPTGAGKSTLVSLLARFFDPWQGRILLDGLDIRHATLESLRRSISIVLQEPFLLPLSVADNIAYGRPGAQRQEIIEAAVAARADDFIRRLPAGYDTVLGERGATLSGGERQRLAIARALLKNAPVLILDEPTSALDPHTEGLLLEALRRLTQGRTSFVIAHRLSTIRHADRIAVLSEGRLVEWGCHQELVTQGGLYSRLYAHQFAGAGQEVVA